jgi:hypothetical protein
MTDDKIALPQMLEKGSHATFLREMIGFAAHRVQPRSRRFECVPHLGLGSVFSPHTAQRRP